MSEKRFEFYSDEDLIGVLDTVTGRTFNSFEILDCLNEQQATILQLKEMNEQLKQKLENLDLNEKNDTVKMVDGKVFIRM